MQASGWGPAPGSPQEGKRAHGCHPTGQGGVTAVHGGVTGPTWSFPRTLRDPKGAVLPPSGPQAFLSAIPLSLVPAPDGRGRKGPSFCSSPSTENPSQRATSWGAHPAGPRGPTRLLGSIPTETSALQAQDGWVLPPRPGGQLPAPLLAMRLVPAAVRRAWGPARLQAEEGGGRHPRCQDGAVSCSPRTVLTANPLAVVAKETRISRSPPQPQSPGARMGGTRGAVRRDLRGRSPHGEELGRWRRGTVWNRPHLEAHQVTCPPRTHSTRTVVTQKHERPQLTSEGM